MNSLIQTSLRKKLFKATKNVKSLINVEASKFPKCLSDDMKNLINDFAVQHVLPATESVLSRNFIDKRNDRAIN